LVVQNTVLASSESSLNSHAVPILSMQAYYDGSELGATDGSKLGEMDGSLDGSCMYKYVGQQGKQANK
jgi:hypothetical protein